MGTRTTEVGRLIELCANAISLTREDKRSPEITQAILKALQDYKENRQGEEAESKPASDSEKQVIKILISIPYLLDLYKGIFKDKIFSDNAVFKNILIELPEKTEKIIKRGRKLGFDLHFLPKACFSQQDGSNWELKPDPYFFELQATANKKGNIKVNDSNIVYDLTTNDCDPFGLWGELVLIDSRPKPLIMQDYHNDFLSSFLGKKIRTRILGSMGRFGISPSDFFFIGQEVAKVLKIKKEQVRMPRYVEFCFLANCFYPHWVLGDTMEWFWDSFNMTNANSGRTVHLRGGNKNKNNYIHIEEITTDDKYKQTGFRPLVVLGFLTDEPTMRFVEI